MFNNQILNVMKRKILKLVNGTRKDGSTWYGVVLDACLTEKGLLLEEKMVFVNQTIHDKLKEEAWTELAM
jgi:hypothetical protein